MPVEISAMVLGVSSYIDLASRCDPSKSCIVIKRPILKDYDLFIDLSLKQSESALDLFTVHSFGRQDKVDYLCTSENCKFYILINFIVDGLDIREWLQQYVFQENMYALFRVMNANFAKLNAGRLVFSVEENTLYSQAQIERRKNELSKAVDPKSDLLHQVLAVHDPMPVTTQYERAVDRSALSDQFEYGTPGGYSTASSTKSKKAGSCSIC